MAQPARSRHTVEEEPPLVRPSDLDRAYRLHRARRQARIEHRRAVRRARLRFWFVLGSLVLGCLVLLVTIWTQVEHIFGL